MLSNGQKAVVKLGSIFAVLALIFGLLAPIFTK